MLAGLAAVPGAWTNQDLGQTRPGTDSLNSKPYISSSFLLRPSFPNFERIMV